MEKREWLDGLRDAFNGEDTASVGMLDGPTVFRLLQDRTPGASPEDLRDLINDWRLPDGLIMYMNMINGLKNHKPSEPSRPSFQYHGGESSQRFSDRGQRGLNRGEVEDEDGFVNHPYHEDGSLPDEQFGGALRNAHEERGDKGKAVNEESDGNQFLMQSADAAYDEIDAIDQVREGMKRRGDATSAAASEGRNDDRRENNNFREEASAALSPLEKPTPPPHQRTASPQTPNVPPPLAPDFTERNASIKHPQSSLPTEKKKSSGADIPWSPVHITAGQNKPLRTTGEEDLMGSLSDKARGSSSNQQVNEAQNGPLAEISRREFTRNETEIDGTKLGDPPIASPRRRGRSSSPAKTKGFGNDSTPKLRRQGSGAGGRGPGQRSFSSPRKPIASHDDVTQSDRATVGQNHVPTPQQGDLSKKDVVVVMKGAHGTQNSIPQHALTDSTVEPSSSSSSHSLHQTMRHHPTPLDKPGASITAIASTPPPASPAVNDTTANVTDGKKSPPVERTSVVPAADYDRLLADHQQSLRAAEALSNEKAALVAENDRRRESDELRSATAVAAAVHEAEEKAAKALTQALEAAEAKHRRDIAERALAQETEFGLQLAASRRAARDDAKEELRDELEKKQLSTEEKEGRHSDRHASPESWQSKINDPKSMTAAMVTEWLGAVKILSEKAYEDTTQDQSFEFDEEDKEIAEKRHRRMRRIVRQLDGRSLAFMWELLTQEGDIDFNLQPSNGKRRIFAATSNPWEFLRYLSSELCMEPHIAIRFAYELQGLFLPSAPETSDGYESNKGKEKSDHASRIDRGNREDTQQETDKSENIDVEATRTKVADKGKQPIVVPPRTPPSFSSQSLRLSSATSSAPTVLRDTERASAGNASFRSGGATTRKLRKAENRGVSITSISSSSSSSVSSSLSTAARRGSTSTFLSRKSSFPASTIVGSGAGGGTASSLSKKKTSPPGDTSGQPLVSPLRTTSRSPLQRGGGVASAAIRTLFTRGSTTTNMNEGR